MTALAPAAWNARLLTLYALGVDAIVNLPAPVPEQSQPLHQHALGHLLQTLSPSAACVANHPHACATIAFGDQRSIWLQTPHIWGLQHSEISGPQWISWGAYATDMRIRCLQAGWPRIAWLIGIALTPELVKVARYSLGAENPLHNREWLITATENHPFN